MPSFWGVSIVNIIIMTISAWTILPMIFTIIRLKERSIKVWAINHQKQIKQTWQGPKSSSVSGYKQITHIHTSKLKQKQHIHTHTSRNISISPKIIYQRYYDKHEPSQRKLLQTSYRWEGLDRQPRYHHRIHGTGETWYISHCSMWPCILIHVSPNISGT